MARHGRDIEAIKAAFERADYWIHREPGEDVHIFDEGDTRYEVRPIAYGPNRYIIDSYSPTDPARRVRYVLDKDLGPLEIRYVIPEQGLDTCSSCGGTGLVWCCSRKSVICTDCGFEE